MTGNAATCDCAHGWRRTDREGFLPRSLCYVCADCGRRAERRRDLVEDDEERYLTCDLLGGFNLCRWPACVSVPRSARRRVFDRLREWSWLFAAGKRSEGYGGG